MKSESLGVGNMLSYINKSSKYNPPVNSQTSKKVSEVERDNLKQERTTGVESILKSSQEYLKSLRTTREQNSLTALKVKKVKYQFKDISSKIIRSKTSLAAKQAVTMAKREVMRLKQEKQNEDADTEELDAAIAHAKAMERVARKKVKHLEEEEMAKSSGGICQDKVVDEEMELEEKLEPEEEMETEEEYAQEEVPLDDMSEVFDDMEDGMKDLMEDMGLDELADSIGTTEVDIDPQDLKAMKIKHRNKEMKDIVKADAEYLKVVFEHFQEQKTDVSYVDVQV